MEEERQWRPVEVLKHSLATQTGTNVCVVGDLQEGHDFQNQISYFLRYTGGAVCVSD